MDLVTCSNTMQILTASVMRLLVSTIAKLRQNVTGIRKCLMTGRLIGNVSLHQRKPV